MNNICKHCKKEFNFILPDGLCFGCRDYINAKNMKCDFKECFICGGLYKDITNSEVAQDLKKCLEKEPYDLSDFDKEFFILPTDIVQHKNTELRNKLKQYIQAKIDQEVKKVLEEIKMKIKRDMIGNDNLNIEEEWFNISKEEDINLIDSYLK